MTADWEAWAASRPGDLDEFEEYTVTLLHTLWRIRTSASFEWGLTGGTALQSFFDEGLRRYSSDLEIITPADEATVEAWMRDQGWAPESVGKAPILKAPLTPDGTLFVIHDYSDEGYAAAAPADAPFRHYPLPSHPPPGELVVPILDFGFLVATKVFGVRDPRRGGERFKDAHDLSLALPAKRTEKLKAQLGAYLVVRNEARASSEVIRQAGAWMRFLSGPGLARFEAERRRFVRDATPFDAATALARAVDNLERMYGAPINPTPNETRRFLLYDVPLGALGRIARRLGYEGSVTREFEKMADFLAARAFPRLGRDAPSTAEELLAELENA